MHLLPIIMYNLYLESAILTLYSWCLRLRRHLLPMNHAMSSKDIVKQSHFNVSLLPSSRTETEMSEPLIFFQSI